MRLPEHEIYAAGLKKQIFSPSTLELVGAVPFHATAAHRV